MSRRLARLAVRLLATVGLVVLVATFTPLGFWYATWLAGPWNDPPGDTLIVLGADSEASGLIARNTYNRSLYAALVWRQGGFRQVLVSGGASNRPAVAELMRDYLVFAGVPADAVRLEPLSSSTRENAQFARPLLPPSPGRLVLLTSDYHMFRAHRAFRKAGLDVLPRPIPDVRKRWQSPAQRWGACLDLAVETAKILYYYWEGWI